MPFTTGTSKAAPRPRVGVKSERLKQALAACLVFATVAALFLALFNRETTLSNEIGYNLVPAERVLQGETPYRDFLTLYPPATIYLNAALFAWFGIGLYTALAGVLAFKLATTLVIYFAGRAAMPRRWAIAAALCSAIWLRPNGPFKPAPMQYGGLFLALALLALLKYKETHKNYLLFGLGASLSLLALFKHNIGAYALAGSLLFVALEGRTRPTATREPVVKAVLITLAGFALPLTPVLFFMKAEGAFQAMVDALLFGPGEFLATRLALPASPLLYGPLLVFVAAAAVYFKADEERRFEILALSVCGVAAFLEAFPRFAREQLVACMPFVTLLLFYLVHLLMPVAERRARGRTKAGLALAAVPLAFLFIGARLLLGTYFDGGLRFRSDTQADIDRGRGVYFPRATALEIEEVVAYISQRVPAEGYFFAHSREGSSFLFLSGRKNPSPAQFWSGVGVTPPMRARTLEALRMMNVSLVVTSDKDLMAEQWEPMREYLNRTFKPARRFGETLILERIDSLN